jgi:hypothetical protein
MRTLRQAIARLTRQIEFAHSDVGLFRDMTRVVGVCRFSHTLARRHRAVDRTSQVSERTHKTLNFAVPPRGWHAGC